MTCKFTDTLVKSGEDRTIQVTCQGSQLPIDYIFTTCFLQAVQDSIPGLSHTASLQYHFVAYNFLLEGQLLEETIAIFCCLSHGSLIWF